MPGQSLGSESKATLAVGAFISFILPYCLYTICDPLYYHWLARRAFEFHTRTYLGFEISTFTVAKRQESLYTTKSVYCLASYYSVTGQLLMVVMVHLVVFVES